MNAVERHPYAFLIAAGLLAALVQTMDYHDQAEIRYIEKPASLCRLPDVDSEYRVIIERRDDMGRVLQECHVVPRNLDESPGVTMKRLLDRKRTNT